jgi:hypothetical protein
MVGGMVIVDKAIYQFHIGGFAFQATTITRLIAFYDAAYYLSLTVVFAIYAPTIIISRIIRYDTIDNCGAAAVAVNTRAGGACKTISYGNTCDNTFWTFAAVQIETTACLAGIDNRSSYNTGIVGVCTTDGDSHARRVEVVVISAGVNTRLYLYNIVVVGVIDSILNPPEWVAGSSGSRVIWAPGIDIDHLCHADARQSQNQGKN